MSRMKKPAAAAPSVATSNATPNNARTQPSPSEEVATPRQKAITVAGNAWVPALRKLLGYPEPFRHYEVLIAWGELQGSFTLAILKAKAKAHKYDMVYLDFAGPVEDGPTNIILLHHEQNDVTVSENCELWMDPRPGWVEILTTKHRYFLDDDCHLRRKPNRLDEMRARRVRMAHDAWRKLAVEMAKQAPLSGSSSTGARGDKPTASHGDGAPDPAAASSSSTPSPDGS